MKIVTDYLFSTTDIDMLTIHIIFTENLSSNLSQPKQQQGIKTQLIIGVRLRYRFSEQFVDTILVFINHTIVLYEHEI